MASKRLAWRGEECRDRVAAERVSFAGGAQRSEGPRRLYSTYVEDRPHPIRSRSATTAWPGNVYLALGPLCNPSISSFISHRVSHYDEVAARLGNPSSLCIVNTQAALYRDLIVYSVTKYQAKQKRLKPSRPACRIVEGCPSIPHKTAADHHAVLFIHPCAHIIRPLGTEPTETTRTCWEKERSGGKGERGKRERGQYVLIIRSETLRKRVTRCIALPCSTESKKGWHAATHIKLSRRSFSSIGKTTLNAVFVDEKKKE